MLFPERHTQTNRWVDQLPAASRRRLLAAADVVPLTYKQTLVPVGERIEAVYLPTTAFISVLLPADRGRLEIAVIGREGFYGLPVAWGLESAEMESVVQGAGFAQRVGAADFRRLLRDDPALRAHVDRYAYVRMQQAARNAVCNRFHRIEQRMARWLLASADRAQSSVFDVTQAFLAEMLGVRRVGVTTAAQALQERRLIKYSRGSVTIRSRDGLRKAACSCYAADLETYRSVFE